MGEEATIRTRTCGLLYYPGKRAGSVCELTSLVCVHREIQAHQSKELATGYKLTRANCLKKKRSSSKDVLVLVTRMGCLYGRIFIARAKIAPMLM